MPAGKAVARTSAFGLLAAIFGLDCQTELGVALAILYVFPVALTYAIRDRQGVQWMTAIGCLLAAFGLLTSPPGGEHWKVFANRSLSILAVAGAGMLCLRNLQTLRYAEQRTEEAVRLAADLQKQRALQQRRARTLLSITEDLQIERKNLLAEVQERRLAEEALAKSEQRMRAIIEASPSGMLMINDRGAITLVNSQIEQMFGYERDELIGQPIEILLPERFRSLHQEQRRAYLATPETRRMGEGRELFGRRRDASEFSVEVGINPIVTPQGLSVLAAVVDISQRVAAEQQLAAYAAELERSNQELEQFAYVASHDLREPLRKVSACCQALAEDYADKLDADAREWIDFAVDGARRMSRLIADLLSYSRVGRRGAPLTDVDADAALQNALLHLEETIEASGAQIEAAELPPIHGDETLLLLLFQNLVGNSLKYRQESVAPHVTIECHDQGDRWQFSIKDNGIGIAPEYHQRVFEIFQRLHSKEAYSGTGIGLAICKRIVHHLGGELWLESVEGEGSTFYFTLQKAKGSGDGHDSRSRAAAVAN